MLTVLQILTQEAVDPAVRQAAAVFFKNLVKAHWSPEDETQFTVPADTKTQVKNGLLTLFLSVPAKLQAQLSEAMSLIATHDFPQQWPNLLTELVGQLSAAAGATPRDYAKISGLLAIAHSITGRYRHEFKSDTLYAEIKTVLEAMQSPLLELSKLASSDLPAATAAGKGPITTLLGTLTLICKLFYDLTAQDLPEFFEDHLAEWMSMFNAVLKYSNPDLDADEDDTDPSPISLLQVRSPSHHAPRPPTPQQRLCTHQHTGAYRPLPPAAAAGPCRSRIASAHSPSSHGGTAHTFCLYGFHRHPMLRDGPQHIPCCPPPPSQGAGGMRETVTWRGRSHRKVRSLPCRARRDGRRRTISPARGPHLAHPSCRNGSPSPSHRSANTLTHTTRSTRTRSTRTRSTCARVLH